MNTTDTAAAKTAALKHMRTLKFGAYTHQVVNNRATRRRFDGATIIAALDALVADGILRETPDGYASATDAPYSLYELTERDA